jgi:ubiquinone/menaquinone biosynthesis C-methylase UbiE
MFTPRFPGCKVLDVGTGTAEVAIAVASHIRKNQGGKMGSSKVLGVDPSEGMITVSECGERGFRV